MNENYYLSLPILLTDSYALVDLTLSASTFCTPFHDLYTLIKPAIFMELSQLVSELTADRNYRCLRLQAFAS
jgi:hypothetical protein